MTQFVNNNVASGNIIYASDHNEQGARVAAVLNGNVDTTNLADNAITSSKIANNSVTPAKLAISKTVDANGWTVYDYGAFRQYRKKGNSAHSLAGNGWAFQGSIPLPVGMTSIGTCFVESTVNTSDAAVLANLQTSDGAATFFGFSVNNKYGNTLSYTIYYSICMTTA